MLAACSSGGDRATPPTVVQNELALTEFNTCSELETYLEDAAINEVNVHLDNLKNFRGWGWGRGIGVDDFAEGGPVPTTDAAGDQGRGEAPDDFTETNNQVEGVDEGDFVKTNGTHIFVLSGQKLYMNRSWPADSMTKLDDIEIEGYANQMFLNENGDVVVFSYYYPNTDASSLYWCFWGCRNEMMTKVTVLSTDNDELNVAHQIYLNGSFANARRIGSSIRLIMRDNLNLPEGVVYYPEGFLDDPREQIEAWEAAIEAAKAQNIALIRAQSLDDWLDDDYYVDGSGNRITMQRDCQSFSRSNATVHLGIASVATINLNAGNGGIAMSTTSILGEVGEVYASRDSLYLATPHWWWWPADDQQNHTYLHKFDISNPNRAVYRASGVVTGYPINQFALDEHDGNLRIATTIDEWNRRDNAESEWDFERRTYNRVTVLAEEGGELKNIGQTRDLAERERITAARFMGEKGYLVTFEQIDPLFTLDLSNPAQPTVVGELKIPGFSTYLHPLDENHLLAIGVDLPEPDADGRVDWSQRRMKLSIFDVSDVANPREKFTEVVGTAYGWSEAAWNHKAFNYFGARQMLAIPFSDYRPGTAGDEYWNSFVSDLRLFHIDADTGITPRGAVSMTDVFRSNVRYEWDWYWSPWVRRSVMADDFVYAITDGGIKAANMAAPSTAVSTVLFDGYEARN